MAHRIDYNEEMVGNAHPTKGDTLNRLINLITAAGQLLYGTAVAAMGVLPIGMAGQILEVNAGATAPQWRVSPDSWMIDIDVFMTPVANVNWNSNTVDTACLYNGYNISSGAQNDSISWPVVLGAGTWTVEIMHVKNDNVGVYSVQLDDVEKGTIDGYAAAASRNQRDSVTGIVVAITAKVTLKLKMATKNGASSAYRGWIQRVRLIRTA
jgi:hypothetical protein